MIHTEISYISVYAENKKIGVCKLDALDRMFDENGLPLFVMTYNSYDNEDVMQFCESHKIAIENRKLQAIEHNKNTSTHNYLATSLIELNIDFDL